ncbi:MAG: DoxX family protein [Saprospiraceae bacterium]|nr:DoxX family protein [Saprospiraceae bacterium]
MNIVLWVLQVLLALHTIMGALWKFSNSEQTVPSLSSIPHSIWLTLSVIELLCSLGLILAAFNKSLGRLVPMAAIVIAIEMCFFSVVHLTAGDSEHSQMIYWLVVAAICGLIAYGRFVVKPICK